MNLLRADRREQQRRPERRAEARRERSGRCVETAGDSRHRGQEAGSGVEKSCREIWRGAEITSPTPGSQRWADLLPHGRCFVFFFRSRGAAALTLSLGSTAAAAAA